MRASPRLRKSEPRMPSRPFRKTAPVLLGAVAALASGAGGAPATAQAPPQAVTVAAGQSLQAAVDAHPPGTHFLIKADVHRLQSVVPKDGNTFTGEPGAVLSGARRLDGAIRQGDTFVFHGQDQQGTVQGECEDDRPRCVHPEDLFLDDRLLVHVATLAEVVPGTWHFDYAADRIVMADDPRGRRVEASVISHAFSGSAANVTIQGLTIEKYATPLQQSVVDASAGTGWTIARNVVQLNHAAGVVGGTGSRIEYNKLNLNGQHGVGAVGANAVVHGNEVAYNNTIGVSTAWSAGGSKFAETTGLTVSANCVHDNNGPGLWTDISNLNALIERNIVYGNTEVGIYHEISYAAVIRDNLVADNGSDSPGWVFGAQIMVSTSSDTVVEDNRVQVPAGYGQGITVGAQSRPPWTTLDNIIRNNDVTFLGATGTVSVATDIAGFDATLYSRTTLDGNAYHVTDLTEAHWGWNNAQVDWTTLRSNPGVEATGTLDTNVVPLDVSCATVF